MVKGSPSLATRVALWASVSPFEHGKKVPFLPCRRQKQDRDMSGVVGWIPLGDGGC